MVRTIVYWASTTLTGVALLGAVGYLTGSPEVVGAFDRVGYPQHLRVVLGIAKPAAAIVLLVPGLVLMKEWAYAGAAMTWVMATIAHYAAGEGPEKWAVPPVLLALLVVSYLTRPAHRRPRVAPAAPPRDAGQRAATT